MQIKAKHNKDPRLAFAWGWILVLVCGVWGIQFSLISLSLSTIGPLSFNFVRFLIAAACVAGVWWRLTRHRRNQLRASIEPGLILGCLLFGGFSTQTIGIGLTTASNAGFITGLNTVMVPVLAWFILRDRLRLYVLGAVIMGFIGTALLSGGIDGFGVGEAWVLACALFFALHIVLTGRYTQHGDSLSLTLVQMITVALLSLVGALLRAEPVMALPELLGKPGSGTLWLALLLGATIGSAFAYFAQTVAQRYLAAWRIGLIYTTEPLFSALGAWFILGERLVASAWLGAALIVTGMLVAELVGRDSDKEEISTYAPE